MRRVGQTDIAVGARAIFDDHILLECGSEFARDQAREQIVRSAGRKVCDDGDRAIRPFGARWTLIDREIRDRSD